MRYCAIKTCDINNGPGIRTTLWTQGCPFKCEGCHNPETWSYDAGTEWSREETDLLIKELSKGQDLSILGGEPLVDQNLYALKRLLTELREKFAFINIWLWTGYLFEDIKDLELIKMIDVVVDGRFDKSKYDESLKYCGSTNQRVIDVKKSLKFSTIFLYDEE